MSVREGVKTERIVIKEVESAKSQKEIESSLRKEIDALNKHSTEFTELIKLMTNVLNAKDNLIIKELDERKSDAQCIVNANFDVHRRELELVKKESELNKTIIETNTKITTIQDKLELKIAKLEQELEKNKEEINLHKAKLELENQIRQIQFEKDLIKELETKYKDKIKKLEDAITEEKNLSRINETNKKEEQLQIELEYITAAFQQKEKYEYKLVEKDKIHSDERISYENTIHEKTVIIDKLTAENEQLKKKAKQEVKKSFLVKLFLK